MLWFLRRRPPAGGRAGEHWGTRFGWLERGRLEEEDTPAFSTRKQAGRFTLELKRRNLFAWSVSRQSRYGDFVLQTRFRFGAGNGHCAAGCVFRYSGEESFYYFLVSSRGAFRLDAVANGHPPPLIEWTECPALKAAVPPAAARRPPPRRRGRSSCGSSPGGTTSPSTRRRSGWRRSRTGRCGKAPWGWPPRTSTSGTTPCSSSTSLQVESRPVEVEKAFERWVRVLPAEPACRLALGRTFFAMGRYNLAAVQIRKALKQAPGPAGAAGGGAAGGAVSADDLFLFGEVLLRLGMHEEALRAFERCRSLDPGRDEALVEKANLLYLLNRHLEARETVREVLPRQEGSAFLHNLLGNVEYALGNWPAALEAYRAAAQREPDSGLFPLHAARCLERLERPKEAVAAYLEAARLLFRREAYADLELILERLKKLAPRDREVQAVEARLLFRDGRQEEAERLFVRLIEAGSRDSAVHFLHGLVLAGRGGRREALPFLEEACRLEPDCALYWLRLAESRHLLGEDPQEALEHALRLAPDDPWVNNLLGMVRLGEGRLEEAGGALRRALEAAPGEADILINYTEYLDRAGEGARALQLLAEAVKAAKQAVGQPPRRLRGPRQRISPTTRRKPRCTITAATCWPARGGPPRRSGSTSGRCAWRPTTCATRRTAPAPASSWT